MDYSAMRLFLSEENIKIHLEYLKKQRLLYSILQKSYPGLIGDDIRLIHRQGLPKSIKMEALRLLCDIKSHEIFFNSFIYPTVMCQNVKRYFGSEEKMIYDLYIMAKDNSHGFIYICLDKNGIPSVQYGNEPLDVFIKYEPMLAFDLCEHTYFKDYGFSKEKFLDNSLRYLNFKKLDYGQVSLDK